MLFEWLMRYDLCLVSEGSIMIPRVMIMRE
jgi:hypothetical protein